MANIDIERRAGLSSSVAVKGPCRVATTANITLSGLQTIDTAALAEFDRVLVKNQTDAKYNGIYEVSTGEWQRTPDFRSNRDVVNGTRVYVTSGAVGSGDWVVDAPDPITFDVDDINFTYFNLAQVDAALALKANIASPTFTGNPAAPTPAPGDNDTSIATTAYVMAATPAATTGVAGLVSLAGEADVLAGSDATKAVTPDALYALWGKGIDVTAAATLTLGAGKLFNVLGNTTITDIDFAVPADGRRATLIFEGAPLLTHNATTLNLPGGENIQVVAGDRCDVVQDDADNVYITNYTPGSASPYRIGDWTPAFSATGSTFNYTTQYGRFIKIGKMVQLWGRLDLATSGNTLTANVLSITGLPFTSRSGKSQLGGMTQWSNTTTSYIAIRLSIPAGGTAMTLLSQTAAATTVSGAVVASGLHATSGTVFIFTATYEAA